MQNDEGIFSRNYNLPEPKRQKDDEKTFCAVAGVVSALVVVGLWIAVFCKVELDLFILFFLPFCTASVYFFHAIYTSKCKRKKDDKFSVFVFAFYVVNIIATIIGGFSDDKGVSAVAIVDLILTTVLFRFFTKNW